MVQHLYEWDPKFSALTGKINHRKSNCLRQHELNDLLVRVSHGHVHLKPV
jgi:hypothetical protein